MMKSYTPTSTTARLFAAPVFFKQRKWIPAGLMALMLVAVFSRETAAQSAPTPPTPPATITIRDLGDLGVNQTIISDVMSISGDQKIWFKFRLTSPVTPANWLNIDTSRSTINTQIGMYNEWMECVGGDDYSGGGTTLANSFASALTFGSGNGQRLGEDGAGWVGSRIDTGWNPQVAGGWRPYLGTGVFYVVVVGYSADFSQCPNPNFNVSTANTATGTARLRLRTGQSPQTFWNEYHHGADAGYAPEVAQVVEGTGPLTTLVGSFNPGERDVFKIRICDPALFRVTATLTLGFGNTYRGALFLFDSNGRGVLGINNTIAGTDTILSVPSGMSLSEGDYYIGVSSYCGGRSGFQHVPYSANKQALWNFANSSSWNQSISPNGTGQAEPAAYAGLQSDCESNSDYYFFRLSLIGACHVPPPPAACRADFNGVQGVTVQDLFDYLAAWFAGCP